MKVSIQITEEDHSFIKQMALELFESPRTNYKNQTLAEKTKSCYKGEICEKAVRTLFSGERAVCPDYSHDILAPSSEISRYFDPPLPPGNSRIEVKYMNRSPRQKFITFEWYRFFHLMNSVKSNLVDLVVVADILESSQTSAEVEILAIFLPQVFKDKYTYMAKSKFSDSYYFKDIKIEKENLGKLYWRAS